ncbi:MAG: lipoate--protein ligase family protein [Thermoplasmatota archaeon]
MQKFDKLRYIPPIEADASQQMAIDETLLKMYDEGNTLPTLRFYRFKPSAISIGYSQGVKEVIDIETCKKYDIPYIRRVTGGGTVFHDYEGEITYSIITNKMRGEIEDSFYTLLEPIIEVLKDYGLDAQFKPYNDILVDGRKISGSAQKRGKKGLLQHGTLMYGTDLDILADILILDEEKIKQKGADSFFDLVTTMENELGWKPKPEKLIVEMKNKYKEFFDAEIVESKISEEEKKNIKNLKDKYNSREWTFDRKRRM